MDSTNYKEIMLWEQQITVARKAMRRVLKRKLSDPYFGMPLFIMQEFDSEKGEWGFYSNDTELIYKLVGKQILMDQMENEI